VRKPIHRIAAGGLLCAAGVLLSGVANAAASPPDFSGFWEVRGELPQAQPAELTAKAKVEVARLREQRTKESGAVAPEARWCRRLGLPFFMSSSPPIDIVQGKDEIAIMGEQMSDPQHVYMDGRKFPDKDVFDFQANGFSVGHFEGETLVVETRYFATDWGQPFISGGAYKTNDTVLVERFKMLEGGSKMEVNFTWTDPSVFVKPHSYTFTYYRSEPGTYALEMRCDAADPSISARLVGEPAQ
jgi:hypothetical protein